MNIIHMSKYIFRELVFTTVKVILIYLPNETINKVTE